MDAVQRELDAARAEIERKDIELDQAFQDKEAATVDLESTLESVRKELQHVKQEKEGLAVSRATLQTQLTTLSATQSTSSTEVESLRHRIEETEREKRDLVTVVSRLKDDGAQREGKPFSFYLNRMVNLRSTAEEIQTLRANLKQARQEHQNLETQLRELRSSETAMKFKVDTISQQLRLATEQASRASDELTAKVEEFARFRQSKHADLAKLQASHDALVQTHAGVESQFKALQSAHTAQSHHLTQALTRVQTLTGQLAEQEATYSSEAAGLKRLVEMMEAREAEAKAVVDSIERDWAAVNDKADRRETVLKEEIEEQRQRAEEAERKVEELETVLDRVDRGEFPIPSSVLDGATPSTPARRPGTPSMTSGTPDFLTQGMMGLSPTVAMASRAQRSGKTFTEVYADYVRLQEEFAKKSAEFDNMDRTLSAVLAQIEERAPILSQQRAEYERLQSEASQLASQLAQALSERDMYASASEENSQKLSKSSKENDLLQKQLDDLGRQLRVLLKEVGRLHDSSIPPDDELDLDENTRPAENIEAVITNNLVLFRSIPQLQEQNQKLLKIVRELGSKMESEEKEYRDALEKEQSEAVREAHEAIKQLQEQLESHKKSGEVTIQAYMKERDSLRAMLSRDRSTEQPPPMVNGDVHSELDSSGSHSHLEKELAEVHSQFEAYKAEMGVDSGRLREEVLTAQREAGRLGAALAKANAQVEFLNERHRMIQEQSIAQSRELDNMSKRNQQLYDQYTRIDIECNRVSEELLTANSITEQLRSECANLRAEKKIWESVQTRLVEENRILTVERSHLSDLMGNVQKMHSDLERSGENDRRRLENQIKMLENQTQDLRSQLSQEREALRHIDLQKDIEVKELQSRMEKASQEFAKTREALVAAETSKKHLEERVEDLVRQLQGNEEKLAVYERRATGVNGVAQRPDEDLTREQQLEAEVAELRSALKVAQVDLTAARSHVQQFQEISQANEAALATLNSTHDEYKAATDAELAKSTSEYNALQERFQTIQQELEQLSEKNLELRRSLETERIAWTQDRKTLEDTIVDMSASERNSENDRASRESEVRQQVERAKAAEDRYSREVMAHADALKVVDELKEQLSKSQHSLRTATTAYETAQAKLITSETSWKQQKDALDKEIADLNARCKDLGSQNGLLHQHLESVSSQAARIRQAADSTSDTAVGEPDSTDADAKYSELRAVITYLRREKEIVDLQLDLSKQETTRLKTQVDYLSHNLEETRRALSEERERAVETASSEAQHVELLERINQLTILRESNATLRADCDRHAKRARELDTMLKQISGELDPAKEQLRIAQAELEAKDHQIEHLEQESQRWKERNSQLLSKYDRIDPAEVQSLKDEIERLKVQKDELEKAISERDQRLTVQDEKAVSMQRTIDRNKEIGIQNNQKFRASFERFNAEKAQMTSEIDGLKAQIQALTSERDELKDRSRSAPTMASVHDLSEEVDALRRDKVTLEQSLADAQSRQASFNDVEATIATLREERDKLLAEKSSWNVPVSDGANQLDLQRQWDGEKAELIRSREDVIAQAKAATEQAQKAVEEAKNLRLSNEKFQAKIQDLSKGRAADSERAAAQQQAAVDAAVEKLRAELQVVSSSTSSDEVAARHARELQELEERLTTRHREELKAAVEAAIAQGQTHASVSSPDVDQAVQAAVAANEAKLKEQHEQELAGAVERGRMEQAAKTKLKDHQLVRAQAKLKELEGQMQELRKNGVIPQAPPPATTTAKPMAAAPASASTSKPAINAPAAAVAQRTLPRKPSLGHPTAEGLGRGRGAVRGVARGGLAIRGTAGVGRGAAPAASAPPADGTTGEVSIVGAAGKRAREEGETAPDDSLAKRLKPAEGSSKPVTLRRDRVPPPP
ncbi:uncharacterized protein FIBRA_08460 [Fibroporia radiculosa]|uniref:Uncharacterized protein n=1 Tax=Fibroporia radiculosa TaxID=599839 RepID=J4GWU5_9APHY|nr:uncharacterized protein FIBRA_08460 [Fibroporia radiculosa]CCM06215.1 predicted protein [Fibroporia radiculosa]